MSDKIHIAQASIVTEGPLHEFRFVTPALNPDAPPRLQRAWQNLVTGQIRWQTLPTVPVADDEYYLLHEGVSGRENEAEIELEDDGLDDLIGNMARAFDPSAARYADQAAAVLIAAGMSQSSAIECARKLLPLDGAKAALAVVRSASGTAPDTLDTADTPA